MRPPGACGGALLRAVRRNRRAERPDPHSGTGARGGSEKSPFSSVEEDHDGIRAHRHAGPGSNRPQSADAGPCAGARCAGGIASRNHVGAFCGHPWRPARSPPRGVARRTPPPSTSHGPGSRSSRDRPAPRRRFWRAGGSADGYRSAILPERVECGLRTAHRPRAGPPRRLAGPFSCALRSTHGRPARGRIARRRRPSARRRIGPLLVVARPARHHGPAPSVAGGGRRPRAALRSRKLQERDVRGYRRSTIHVHGRQERPNSFDAPPHWRQSARAARRPARAWA